MSDILKYRADLDGVRAIAVAFVVVYHANLKILSGGYIGVDIFFVLSGYFITRILLQEISENNFSILRFYERRARRILPALYLVIAITFPFCWYLMLPNQMEDFSGSVISTVLFFSNFHFWGESEYFAPQAELKPLLHTWSLAIEEQYYFLLPPFLIILCNYFRSSLTYGLAGLILLSLLLSEWGWRNVPSANFYLLPTRVWELMTGSLLAAILVQRNVKSSNILALIGALMMIMPAIVFDHQTPFPSLLTTIPVVGVALIILFAGQYTFVSRILSVKPLVTLGLISYSAYLWHQPVFTLLRLRSTSEPSAMTMIGATLCVVPLAFLSWKYVEQPFRSRMNSKASRRRLYVIGLLTTLILLFIGLMGRYTNGYSDRFSVPKFVIDDEFSIPLRDNGYCFYSFSSRMATVSEENIKCILVPGQGNSEKILIFGDSFAAQWEPFYSLLAKKYNYEIDSVTTNWCFPTLEKRYTAPVGHISRQQCDLNRDWIKKNISDYDVVVIGGEWHKIYAAGHLDGVDMFLDELLKESTHRIIVHDTPVQYYRHSVERAVYFPEISLTESRQADKDSKDAWSLILDRYQDNNLVLLLDRSASGFERYSHGKNSENYPYSLDGSHMSIYGAKMLYRESSTGGPVKIINSFVGQ